MAQDSHLTTEEPSQGAQAPAETQDVLQRAQIEEREQGCSQDLLCTPGEDDLPAAALGPCSWGAGTGKLLLGTANHGVSHSARHHGVTSKALCILQVSLPPEATSRSPESPVRTFLRARGLILWGSGLVSLNSHLSG